MRARLVVNGAARRISEHAAVAVPVRRARRYVRARAALVVVADAILAPIAGDVSIERGAIEIVRPALDRWQVRVLVVIVERAVVLARHDLNRYGDRVAPRLAIEQIPVA